MFIGSSWHQTTSASGRKKKKNQGHKALVQAYTKFNQKDKIEIEIYGNGNENRNRKIKFPAEGRKRKQAVKCVLC